MDGKRLKHVSEIKCLCYVLDELGTDDTECRRKVASGRKIADATSSLGNARGFQFECARVLHEALLVPFLTYCREIMVWKRRRGFAGY